MADQLRKKGKGTPEEARGNAHEHNAQLRTGLEQIAGKHATRLPALFHPDPKTVEEEKAAGRPVADTIPMNVYFWKDDKTGKVHLYDVTTGRPQEQTIDGPPTAATMQTFFEEVARYPKGSVRYTLPDGAIGVSNTSGKTKWYEWVAYAGLVVAGVGLTLAGGVGLGLLAEGASTIATVCFAGGALAGGVSAGGHLADTVHLGTATTTSVVIDVAQVVASLASGGAMGLTMKAGSAAGALANSRWFVPLLGTSAGADAVQLVAFTDLTLQELDKIEHGFGTPEDKQRAAAVLVTQWLVTGGLTVLSVQGARNARALASEPIEIIEQNGVKVARVLGEQTPSSAGAELVDSTPRGTTTNEHAPDPGKQPVPARGPVSRELKAPADHAVEIVKKHKGSIREAIGELNQQGFNQAQMRDALEAAWRSTGRGTAGALIAQDGTLVLVSRRVGPSQPMNLIHPNGLAEFGTGELFIDPKNLKNPIGARNVRTSDGTPLLMPGETTLASSSAAQTAKDIAEPKPPTSERLEELARDPDHGGKITEQTRREAQVALDLENQGKLKAPVRRPMPGDGHSGDFVDGAGGDWDVKAYKSRQTIIDNIRTKAAAKGAPPPKLDPAQPVPGEFELETAMNQLRAELRGGERVIIDTQGLSPSDLALLKSAVNHGNLEAVVIFHE